MQPEQLTTHTLDDRCPPAHIPLMSARIVIDPEVCGGRPIIAGTRVRVSDILDALGAGDGIDELLPDFPYISRDDSQACFVHAARAVGHPVVQVA